MELGKDYCRMTGEELIITRAVDLALDIATDSTANIADVHDMDDLEYVARAVLTDDALIEWTVDWALTDICNMMGVDEARQDIVERVTHEITSWLEEFDMRIAEYVYDEHN